MAPAIVVLLVDPCFLAKNKATRMRRKSRRWSVLLFLRDKVKTISKWRDNDKFIRSHATALTLSCCHFQMYQKSLSWCLCEWHYKMSSLPAVLYTHSEKTSMVKIGAGLDRDLGTLYSQVSPSFNVSLVINKDLKKSHIILVQVLDNKIYVLVPLRSPWFDRGLVVSTRAGRRNVFFDNYRNETDISGIRFISLTE